jgi:DNA-binding response OmpR family regulator
MAEKILIIEDDVFLGDVLLRKLQNENFETELVRDGALGLKRIKEFKPDLVLLDIILPTMNGYEVLEQKLKDESIAKTPVIIISNSGQPVEISHVLALGVKDYLVKAQFDPEEVVNKVKQQLGTTRDENASQPAASGAQNPELGKYPTLSGKKVMWVEDDIFLSEIIARKLSTEGCKLLHFSEGQTALSQVETEMPDIILLDILLSGIDGFEILRQLKERPKTKNIPVILLSNLGQQSDIEKGKKMGADKFLIKATVTLDEIIMEIRRVLSKN